MSLDITFYKRKATTGCYRKNGEEISTAEMLEAFPDYAVEKEEVWWRNITHNVGKIASHVPVNYDNLTLYDILWHPKPEMFEKACWYQVMPYDYKKYLDNAIKYMSDNLSDLQQYNAENGWGTANGLLEYIQDMRSACEKNPFVDEIHVSV